MHLRRVTIGALIREKTVLRSNLTNTTVAKLRPNDSPYEVRDTRLKGLLLRVQPSGVMSWYVEYGRGRRARLGRADAMTAAQAREAARHILGDAYIGNDPMAERRRAHGHTLASFVDEVYGPWAEANLKTAGPTIQRLRRRFPDLQDLPLDQITAWHVEKWRLARSKGGARPTTVNRDLDDLRSALNRAVTWQHLSTNPVRDVKRSRFDRSPRVRFLSVDEEKALRAALLERDARLRHERESANAWRSARGYPLLPSLMRTAFADHLVPMVLISLNTGVRQGELLSLEWHDIDLAHANLTVGGDRAKSGRTRHLPLNAEAKSTLEGWQAQAGNRSGLVFPAPSGRPFDNVRKSWVNVLAAAGITRFRWHDLRHTFASKLVMAGADLNTVRELLGHADYQMTLRYAHLAPEHKAAAVALLDGAP